MSGKKWSKVIYKSDFPDNYTDPRFLEDLRHNMHFKPVDAATALLTTTRISTQICITVIFWSAYLQLLEDSSYWKISVGVFTCFIFTAYGLLDGFRHIWDIVKHGIPFLGVVFFCTPFLTSLAETISTDTIYAMTASLMVLHIMFHRYGMDGTFVSPYMSLNSAVCGAICLTSRLQETKHAFVLLTLAVQAFALFPELYEELGYPVMIFVFSLLSAVLSLILVSGMPAVLLFLILIFVVNVVCPLVFVWAQKYKDNIHGPWDEAILTVRTYV